MRTVKPQRLGILHRTFEHGGKKLFVPTVMIAFPCEAPAIQLHEVVLWQVMGSSLGEGEHAAFDEAMFKPRAELLVSGVAYPPKAPAPSCQVRVRLGPEEAPLVDRRLYVFGDRHWTPSGPSDPEPFVAMPVDWAHAFGGEGFEVNPAGKGARSVAAEDGKAHHPLPNVEDPRRLVRSKRDTPHPAGLSPIPLHWPQRFAKIGTYDAAWRKKRYPGLADDVDLTFFNQAPAEQWLAGYLQGGEPFHIENMHAERPILAGELPRLVARCFVSRQADAGEIEEVGLRLDTVHFFPSAAVGVLFFRGVHEVSEDDAADLRFLLAACEAQGEPRPRSHYQRVLLERLDPELGAMRAMKDSELMPPRPAEAPSLGIESFSDMPELMKTDELVQANQRRRAEKEIEGAREMCREAGLDPDEHVPKELPPPGEPPDMEALEVVWQEQVAEAERLKKEMLDEQERMLAEARRTAEEAGGDFDALLENARSEGGGPPKFRAREEIARLRAELELSRNAGVELPEVEAKLADPELEDKLQQMEEQLVEAYRRFAHHYPAPRRRQDEEAATLRAEVERALGAGESLAGRDLTGADLSGMDLSGASLREAFLEGARLEGAKLAGADLERAVLARADLTGADLEGARLAGANLGEADLTDARLARVDLTAATMGKAKLVRTLLSDAKLDELELLEALFAEVDWSGARARQLLLLRLDLSGMRFVGAQLTETMFIECDVSGADFSGAKLDASVFLGCRGGGSRFPGAQLGDLRIVKESSFAGATFGGAHLSRANLRGTCLSGADFSGAELADADLSEADLRGANLERVVAPRLQMIRADLRDARLAGANLMEGSVAKANIRGADFRGANLFRVDFARIDGDVGTQFDGALMKYIRFVAKEGGMRT